MANPSILSSTKGSVNGTTFNLTIPSTGTPAAGDIVLIFHDGNISAATLNTPTGGTGTWTAGPTFTGGTTRMNTWWKPWVSGDSVIAMNASATTKHSAILLVIRAASTTAPIHASNGEVITNDVDANYTALACTTTQPALIITGFCERSSTPSTSSTISGGGTKQDETYMTGGSAVSSVVSTQGFKSTSGSYGNDTIAWSTSNTTKGAISLAIMAPAAGGSTGGTPKRWDGSAFKTGGTIKRWNGSAFKTGGTVRRWTGSAWKPAP
jgi:hypothetical protein